MYVKAVAVVTLTITITPEDREAIESALIAIDTIPQAELGVKSRQTIGALGDALLMGHGDQEWDL